jgi:cytochrome P450
MTESLTNLLTRQTKQRAYEKDIGFSFSPFMPILGTGLVTADGELWRTQRLLLGPALRTEMLDEVRERGQQSDGPAADPQLGVVRFRSHAVSR